MGFRRIGLTAAALCGIALSSTAARAAEYTIVVLQSLTGAAAFIGAPIKDGMVFAAEEANRTGALGPGNTVKVIVADDATDRAQTLTLISRYVADPSVLMILGPTSGSVALAGASASNDNKIPLMTTTNTLDVLKAGIWSFILTQPGDVTIPHIARYAVETLKTKNCTIIGIIDNESYVILQRLFESTLKAAGVTIGAVEGIKLTDSDFAALSTKVAGRDQDCVFVSAPAPQAANIIIQLRQGGLDPKTRVLGHSSLASPVFVQRGGKAVEGVIFIADWVPGGADDFGRAFAAAFKAKHNSDPDNWVAVGYGGMRVAINALKNAGATPTRDSVREALAKTKGVKVVVGQGDWSLGEDRVPRPGMNVLMVKDGQFVLAPK